MKTKKILSTLICLLIVTSSFAQVSVNITSNPPVSCNGGLVLLTANVSGGTQPYGYIWSVYATTKSVYVDPKVTSYVDVTVTDKNSDTCTAQIFLNVDYIKIDSILEIHNGDSITLTPSGHGGVPPYTYQWNNGQTTHSIIVKSTIDSTYCVIFSDVNGCNDSACVSIIFNSLNELKTNNRVTLFPNPTDRYIYLEKNSNDIDKYFLSISDIQGREVLTKNIQFNDDYKLDLTSFKNGIYFLKLQNNKEITIHKIIVQQ